LITETVHHLIFAVDLFHGASGAISALLAGVMALAFGADGPGPAPALVAAVAAVAAPDLSAPVPSRHLASAETIRRDELKFVEVFVDLARSLRSGEAEAHLLEDLRDFVPVMLGYARQRGADGAELARLHARYWGAVGTATRAVKRRR
jgi:nitrogen fixation/metabolism regulation signal transduction histidine kinase